MVRYPFILAGIIAGAVSAYCFALIHRALISDIGFSLPALLVAGAICGMCLSWTYGALFRQPYPCSQSRLCRCFPGIEMEQLFQACSSPRTSDREP